MIDTKHLNPDADWKEIAALMQRHHLDWKWTWIVCEKKWNAICAQFIPHQQPSQASKRSSEWEEFIFIFALQTLSQQQPSQPSEVDFKLEDCLHEFESIDQSLEAREW